MGRLSMLMYYSVPSLHVLHIALCIDTQIFAAAIVQVCGGQSS